MQGILYIIKNRINNKVYIGKTFDTITRRFIQHKSDAKKAKPRDLYIAFNTLGIENFYIEELGRFDEEELNIKEIQTIKTFDSYKNGYNMTLGGDGKSYFPYSDEEVIQKYKELGVINKVADYFSCDKHTIRVRLLNNKIKIKSNIEVIRKLIYIPEIKRSFGSITDTAKYFYTHNMCKSINSAQKNIRDLLKKVKGRNTYLGYTYIQY
jgi:hypothetical protein